MFLFLLLKVLIILIGVLFWLEILPKFKSLVNDDLYVGKYGVSYLPVQPINLGLLQLINKGISILRNMRACMQKNTLSYPRSV